VKREVTIVRHADRHAELHERQFAQVFTTVIERADDDPPKLIDAAMDKVDLDWFDGRYTIHVAEPHE
jgi:hypothetical protein